MLEALIERCQDAGIEVVWAMDLPCAGVWLAEYPLLILAASHPEAESARACHHALLSQKVESRPV